MKRLRRSVFGAAVACASLFATSTAVASDIAWTDGLTTQQISWVQSANVHFNTPTGELTVFGYLVQGGYLDDEFGPGWTTDWANALTTAECNNLAEDIKAKRNTCKNFRDALLACTNMLGDIQHCQADFNNLAVCENQLAGMLKAYNQGCL